MLKNLQQGTGLKQFKTRVSKDAEDNRNRGIDQVITRICSKMTSIRVDSENMSISDYYDLIFCIIAKKVGQCMKNDEAMLLTVLHRDFVSELSEKGIPNSRWLLSKLYMYFEDNLEVHCRQRCYGTVVFHKGCDMIQALCTALGKSQNIRHQAEHQLESKVSAETEPSSPLNIEKQVQTVALFLNNKLHERARTINASFNESPEKISTVNPLAS